MCILDRDEIDKFLFVIIFNQSTKSTFFCFAYGLVINIDIFSSIINRSIMPSYDDDLPTQEEEILLKQLVDNVEQEQRIQALIEV